MSKKKAARSTGSRPVAKKKTTAKTSARSTARTIQAKPAARTKRVSEAVARKAIAAWGNQGFEQRRKAAVKRAAKAGVPAARQFTIVAEGDSWFDYKPAFLELTGFLKHGKDLLGHLQTSGRINVFRVSTAGDTLENMVYGTDTSGSGTGMKPKLPPQIDETLAAIRSKNADAFFFSGGGNDLAGVELASYLNHKDSGEGVLRGAMLDFVFGDFFIKSYNTLIRKVRAVKPGIPIFLHGYDYAIPDGRGVVNTSLFTWKGPWLRPALVEKRYISPQEGRDILHAVMDRFNDALRQIAAANDNVHYIDLRGTLRDDASYKDDWANELHPTSDGFMRVAAIVEQQMLSVLD